MQVRYLSQEFLKQSKEKLIKKQQEVKFEISQLKIEDPYLVQGRDDYNSEYVEDAINEDLVKENIDLRINELNLSLQQIEKALAKIEEGTYGVCEVTGNAIDIARLEIYPEATTSV